MRYDLLNLPHTHAVVKEQRRCDRDGGPDRLGAFRSLHPSFNIMETVMFDARGLLRLILTTAYSHRELGRLTGRSPTTIARYRALVQDLDFTLAQLGDASDSDLERLFRAGNSPAASRKTQPDWNAVALSVKKGRTLLEAHEAYALEAGDRQALSYRSFCRGYARNMAASHPVMIQRHKPGAAMMVDFAGYRPKGCGDDGAERSFELFVAVLPASDLTFACVVRSQKTMDWVEANERALRFFGGTPETIVCDNLKAAVLRPKGRTGAAVINPTFQAFCEHHGSLASPAGARKPTHKAKAEIGVKLVQRLLRLALNDRPLQRREAINALLLEVLARLNARPLRRAQGESRLSLYQKLDLPALRPLRQDGFPFHAVRCGLMLGPDYHLMHDHRRYSAPYTLIGRKLDLRASATSVEIWHDAQMVALHPRLDTAGDVTTDPNHMPPHHLARRASTEEDLQIWAHLRGDAVRAVASAEAQRPLYGAAKSSLYRSFRDLHARVGTQRLEAACARAIRIGRPRLITVRNILERGLEFTEPTVFTTPDTAAATHENVRGPAYFTEG
ncbi:IS21 family transposase [Brevundimonas naejangsanensis]|uniref:IS21 family transposase n=1 Tax=Brevundimonas naejangsanensis TaxID=588932 RepID=UPI0026EE0231|nr:IS21 family transposase [Brevundimonas naejangsanensis]